MTRPEPERDGKAATFLDFDGTLARTDLVQGYAYYCRHAGAASAVVARHARLLLNALPLLALDAYSRPAFAERLFSLYAGLSQDRLEFLSHRLHAEVIAPRVHRGVPAFLEACRARGPLILVTGAPDFCVRHFAAEHGFEHVIANRLEFRQGFATGRVLPPAVFGSNKARLMREYARARGIDLTRSAAYADSVSDTGMLDVVGRGGVINPSRRLARMARDYQWQVLTL